jgi:hypothetical protein
VHSGHDVQADGQTDAQDTPIAPAQFHGTDFQAPPGPAPAASWAADSTAALDHIDAEDRCAFATTGLRFRCANAFHLRHGASWVPTGVLLTQPSLGKGQLVLRRSTLICSCLPELFACFAIAMSTPIVFVAAGSVEVS